MKNSILILVLLMSVGNASADDGTFRAQARLFFGTTKVNPTDANSLMSSQSLNSFDNLAQVGVEINYPVLRFLDVGMRFAHKFNARYEQNGNMSVNNSGQITQEALLLLARIPLFRSSVFKFDLFGGVGGSNTNFAIKTTSLDGKYSKNFTDDFLASPYFAAGASVGVGYKSFYLYVEGGYDRNRVIHLKPSGTVPSTDATLDLTGPYVMIGLLFDGITVTQK